MQVNAIINATDTSGKKINTTISYIRASQKSQAPTLAQALNALTTNTYTGTQVNEINVDITGKTEPTLTLGSWIEGTSPKTYYAEITYTGDGVLSVSATQPAYINNNRLTILPVNSSTTSFSGTIYASETNNYTAKQLAFSR